MDWAGFFNGLLIIDLTGHIHQLAKQRLAGVHDDTLQEISKGQLTPISNRHHLSSLGKPRHSWRWAVRVGI
jgi:hypothetical protein